jgi:tetratricopeptide (TPR) repeat protein
MSDQAAEQAHSRAGALIDDRQFAEAVEPAGEACRLRPEWSAAWWNYSVALKHARRWADCLAACDRAIELDPDDADRMHWNAGIAATALGNWDRARAAWTAAGIDVPPGSGALEMKIGMGAVRISPDDQKEVVYVDELDLLQSSRYGTWQVIAKCDTPAERDALIHLFEGVDGAVEDWTESIYFICAQCSLGEPHDHHPRDEQWQPERRLAIALRDERELKRLRRLGLWWRKGVEDVTRVL